MIDRDVRTSSPLPTAEPGLIAFQDLFAARLRAALEARHLEVGATLDEDIRTCAQLGRDAVLTVLKDTAAEMFGGDRIPYDRAGDAVCLYVKFVYSLLRTPQDRFWFNDYMFNLAAGDGILDPLRVRVSDKALAKLYVRDVLGTDRAAPTLALLEDAAAVDGYAFPDTCMVKATHSSRRRIARRPGQPFDREEIKSWFRHDYYPRSREANYRGLQPKVIVEPLLFGGELIDLNVFCFDGEPRMLRITTGALGIREQTCLSLDWQPLDIDRPDYPRHAAVPERPGCLDEAKQIAAALSAPFSLIRIDFLVKGGEFFVGEITNLSGGAVGSYIGDGEREMSVRIFGQRALVAA